MKENPTEGERWVIEIAPSQPMPVTVKDVVSDGVYVTYEKSIELTQGIVDVNIEEGQTEN